ncbi:hypothetical protein [Roseateles terrae]|uniref:Uncharacterized protein n=1 Tax=Roseateles terrae TaxID=431060 RepID=A0ABR6GNJ7_9BURK|nr:hypothetical protein [Roseateles terrae]MBB3193685.1 hypothetical protein [Roseateles terrae]OWQ89155.1 hypothetical protein CDN98_00965 [Roseateles terrae]
MSMTIQSPLNMALQGIQSPLAGLQQALQGLQQGLQGLQQLLQPLENLLKNPLASALSGAGQGVAQALGGLGNAAGSPLGGLGQALGGLSQGLGGLGQALDSLTHGLTQGLNPFGQGGMGGMGQNLLGGAFGPQGLGGAINGLAQGLNGVNQAIGGLGQAAMGGAGGALMDSLGKAIEGLGSALGAAGALAGTLNYMGTNGQGPMTPDRALQALAKGMQDSGMKMLSGKDMEDAANGIRPKGMKPEAFTPEFQAACKFLKSDEGKDTMRKLDTADADNAGKGLFKGKADGNVGLGDVTAALQKSGLDAGQREAVATLRENFNALSKDGKTFDMNTVRDVANGMNMPDGNRPSGELIRACQKFMQDTALNLATDNAQKVGEGKFNQQGDQKYSMKDLDKTLARA